jgi:hypothetical protein
MALTSALGTVESTAGFEMILGLGGVLGTNLTVYPESSFFFGAGSGLDSTFATLNNVPTGAILYEGVRIRNISDRAGNLLVNVSSQGSPTEDNSYIVRPRQEVFIQIDDPENITVSGIGNEVDYNWYGV